GEKRLAAVARIAIRIHSNGAHLVARQPGRRFLPRFSAVATAPDAYLLARDVQDVSFIVAQGDKRYAFRGDIGRQRAARPTLSLVTTLKESIRCRFEQASIARVYRHRP